MSLLGQIKKTLLLNINDSLGIVVRSLVLSGEIGNWIDTHKEKLEDRLLGEEDLDDDDDLDLDLDADLDLDGPIDPIADRLDDELDDMNEELDDDLIHDAGLDTQRMFSTIDMARHISGESPMSEAEKVHFMEMLNKGISDPTSLFSRGASQYPPGVRLSSPQSPPVELKIATPAPGVGRHIPVTFVDKSGCPVIALQGKQEGFGDKVKIFVNTAEIPRLSDLQIYGIAVHIHEFETRFRTQRMAEEPVEITERIGGNSIPLFGRNLSLNGADNMLMATEKDGWSSLAAYVAHGGAMLDNAGLRGYPIVTRSEFEGSQISMEISLGPMGSEYRDKPVYVTVSLLVLPTRASLAG